MIEKVSLKKKIKYRSEYRGIKEMDLLLGKFVKKYVDNLSYQELLDLYEILELDDDEIFKWYLSAREDRALFRELLENTYKVDLPMWNVSRDMIRFVSKSSNS